MGHRLPIAKVFWESVGCNVMMLSYRGYGKSEGTPSEKGGCTWQSVSCMESCADILFSDSNRLEDRRSGGLSTTPASVQSLPSYRRSLSQTALDYVTNHPILGKTKIIVSVPLQGTFVLGSLTRSYCHRSMDRVSADVFASMWQAVTHPLFVLPALLLAYAH
jgi:hypothetical protein